jgi:sugar O-acyltransferase (sialic acid O-acetyltransferase NeuD family)
VASNTPMRLVILGAGGHGKEVASYVYDLNLRSGSIDLVGFVDDSKKPQEFAGSRVLWSFEDIATQGLDLKGFRFITAVGDNKVRQRLAGVGEKAGLEMWTLVHNEAYVGDRASLGGGTCIAPGSIITTDVDIGRHCIVNVNASVSHDCNIGDFCNINPGAIVCGDVEIGTGAYVGAGAVIRDKVKVGAWSVIGAGAAVVTDVPEGVTVMGVPARVVDESH